MPNPNPAPNPAPNAAPAASNNPSSQMEFKVKENNSLSQRQDDGSVRDFHAGETIALSENQARELADRVEGGNDKAKEFLEKLRGPRRAAASNGLQPHEEIAELDIEIQNLSFRLEQASARRKVVDEQVKQANKPAQQLAADRVDVSKQPPVSGGTMTVESSEEVDEETKADEKTPTAKGKGGA